MINKGQLPLIHCQQGGIHQNEKINLICLEKSCIDKGDFLLCIGCTDEQHEDHNTIPAKLLFNEILISLEKSPEHLHKKFEQQKLQALEIINTIKQDFLTVVKSTQKSINNLYDQIQSNVFDHKFQFIARDVKQFLKLIQSHRNIDEIKQELKTILYKQNIQNSTNLQEQLLENAKKSTILFDLNQKQDELQQLLQNFQSEVKSITQNKQSKLDLFQKLKYPDQTCMNTSTQDQYSQNINDYSFSQNQQNTQENGQDLQKHEQLQVLQEESQQEEEQEEQDEIKQTHEKSKQQVNKIIQKNPFILIQDSNNQDSILQQETVPSQYSQQSPQFFQKQQQQQEFQYQARRLHQQQNRQQLSRDSSSKSFKSSIHNSQMLNKSQSQSSFKQSFQNSMYDPSNTNNNSNMYSSSRRQSPNKSVKSYNLANSTYSEFYQIDKSAESKFEFSDFYKHDDITIKRNVMKNNRYINQSQVYRTQVLTPTLEDSLPKIQSWSFQIIDCLPAWIGFGITHINNIRERNFEFKRQDFSLHPASLNDHGTYIVTSNGFAFKHGKRPERTNFCLTKGDIVTMRFDPFLNYLIYYKNHDYSNPYNLEFKQELGNKLYPCVILWYPNDEIRLL